MFAALALAQAVLPPDPYALYARARSRWAAQQYPRFLQYDVVVSAIVNQQPITNTYESIADTSQGTLNVRATSREEAAHPYVPQGINFNTKLSVSYTRHAKPFSAPGIGSGSDIQVSKTIRVSPKEQVDVLGVPLLSPTYSFGLAPDVGALSIQRPGAGPLKTIAAETATRRDYEVRYDGTATIDGSICYHLALEPRRRPGLYRLRELWIDANTFATRQALIQGNFTAGPSPRAAWTVDFAIEGGAMYIRDERAMQPLAYLGRRYSGVTVTFSNIEPARAPDYTWSLSLFRTSGDILEEPSF